MVARASSGCIFSSSKVYSRYLQDNEGSQTRLGPYLIGIFIRIVCVHSEPGSQRSPAEQPDLCGAGQGSPEPIFVWRVVGVLKLVPGKLPLFLPTSSQSVTVYQIPQVGGDTEQHVWSTNTNRRIVYISNLAWVPFDFWHSTYLFLTNLHNKAMWHQCWLC